MLNRFKQLFGFMALGTLGMLAASAVLAAPPKPTPLKTTPVPGGSNAVRQDMPTLPVLLDGGIRRGTDIAKALALGASGVLLGRATLFGAVAAGEQGAQRSLDILHDELLRTLRLCGAPNIAQLTPDLLRPSCSV